MVLKHTIMFKWLTLGVVLCLATSTLAVRVYDENVASVSSIIRSNEELINGTSQDAFSSVEGRSYPLFKQCDPLWAKKVLVHDTICKVGCYLTSLAMGLNSWDVSIPIGTAAPPVDPATLNEWLRYNNGYTEDDLLESSAINKLVPFSWSKHGKHISNDIDPETLPDLMETSIVIANVKHGQHFVLVTGWNVDFPDKVIVHDPGFQKEDYSYSNDIVGWRLFRMG